MESKMEKVIEVLKQDTNNKGEPNKVRLSVATMLGNLNGFDWSDFKTALESNNLLIGGFGQKSTSPMEKLLKDCITKVCIAIEKGQTLTLDFTKNGVEELSKKYIGLDTSKLYDTSENGSYAPIVEKEIECFEPTEIQMEKYGHLKGKKVKKLVKANSLNFSSVDIFCGDSQGGYTKPKKVKWTKLNSFIQ